MENFIEASLYLEREGRFVLLGNRVLLQQDNKQETYEQTKIMIPDKYKKWVTKGIVKAIGTKVERDSYDIKINDKVIFDSAIQGIDIIINDVKYKILHPDDIACVVEEE